RKSSNNSNQFLSTIFNRPIKLHLYPQKLEYNTNGGFRIIEITNLGDKRISLKVKSTNKDIFFAKPVFTFITPQSTKFIYIFRKNSVPTKPEKIVIHAVEDYLDTKPTNSFNSLNKVGEQFSIP
ncbi:Major sperm protein, partial [Meloidogyne graminicola]